MGLFDEYKRKKLDVNIEIFPKLEGPLHSDSYHEVYVPHLKKNISLTVPNSISVGQSIRIKGIGLTNKSGDVGDVFFKIVGIERYDIEIDIKAVLKGTKNSVTEISVYVPEREKNISFKYKENNEVAVGDVIRLKGGGLANKEGGYGNLFVRISEIERLDANIDITAKLIGLESEKTQQKVEIPHLNKCIEVTIPNDIEIGQSIRLKGLGNTLEDGMRGDLYLNIESIEYVSSKKCGMGDAYEKMNSLIGLESIKHDVNEMIDFIKVQMMRKKQGLKSVPLSLHCVFLGNPGTGKTTIARILADVYKEIGLLSKGQLVEVDRSDLVGQYIGHTAVRTQEKIQEAMGGILFIDEAYTLIKEDNPRDFGQEAVDTLLKAMEDYRDEFIVIVAGYEDLMERFVNSNPGLKSRFTRNIYFPDYTADEMMKIFKCMCREYQYRLSNDAKKVLSDKMISLESGKGPNFANAREVRNIFEEVVRRQASRISQKPDSDIMLILKEDFG